MILVHKSLRIGVVLLLMGGASGCFGLFGPINAPPPQDTTSASGSTEAGAFPVENELPPPAPTPPRVSSWEVTLTKIKVVDAQEDRTLMGVPISDGDEPYFIMFGVQSRLGESGSTTIQINQYDDDDWAGHLREGQQKNIPVSMGTMRFSGITGSHVIGVVVLALESDRTPWAIIRNRVEEVETALYDAVAESVEFRSEVELRTTAFVDTFHRTLQDAVRPIATPLTTGQALEDLIFSGVDTDEVIDINSVVLMLTPPSQSLSYPHYQQPYLTDRLTNRDYFLNQNALIFDNTTKGARYDVEMRVREF